jgi:hypothetical protein
MIFSTTPSIVTVLLRKFSFISPIGLRITVFSIPFSFFPAEFMIIDDESDGDARAS